MWPGGVARWLHPSLTAVQTGGHRRILLVHRPSAGTWVVSRTSRAEFGWVCDFIDLGSKVAGPRSGATRQPLGPRFPWCWPSLSGCTLPVGRDAGKGSPHEPQASLEECLLPLVNYKLFIYFGNQVTRGCRWALSPGPGRPSVGPGRERVQCFW